MCVGSGLIDQTEASIEEAMSTEGYADVTVSLLSGSILSIWIFWYQKDWVGEKGSPVLYDIGSEHCLYYACASKNQGQSLDLYRSRTLGQYQILSINQCFSWEIIFLVASPLLPLFTELVDGTLQMKNTNKCVTPHCSDL